jgi:hypothetical protein
LLVRPDPAAAELIERRLDTTAAVPIHQLF